MLTVHMIKHADYDGGGVMCETETNAMCVIVRVCLTELSSKMFDAMQSYECVL